MKNFVSPQTLAVSIYYFIVTVGLLLTVAGLLLLVGSFQNFQLFPSAIFVFTVGFAFDVLGYSLYLGKVDQKKAAGLAQELTQELAASINAAVGEDASGNQAPPEPEPVAPPKPMLRFYPWERRDLLSICGVENGDQ